MKNEGFYQLRLRAQTCLPGYSLTVDKPSVCPFHNLKTEVCSIHTEIEEDREKNLFIDITNVSEWGKKQYIQYILMTHHSLSKEKNRSSGTYCSGFCNTDLMAENS